MEHEISVEPIFKSRAKILLKRRETRFLVGEDYELTLKMKNIGKQDFPGGIGNFRMQYTTNQYVQFKFPIKKIKKGDEELSKTFTPGAMGKDFALCSGEISANDKLPVKLFDKNRNERLPGTSLGSIFIETRTGVYTYYLLIISAVSLITLTVLSLAHLISFWIK